MNRIHLTVFAVAVIVGSASCHEPTALERTPAGRYVLVSVLLPQGDTLAIPGLVPRTNGEDRWIVEGSIVLNRDDSYQYLERDSIICVKCGINLGASMETQSFGGTYSISDTLLLLYGGATGSIRDSVIHMVGAQGQYKYVKHTP